MVKANENRVDHWVELVIDDSLSAGDSPNQFGADCELMISVLQEHVDAVKYDEDVEKARQNAVQA